MNQKTKNVVSSIIGTGVALLGFYTPEVLAALPAAPDVPIGDIVGTDDNADDLVKKVIGWLMIFAAIGVGLGAAAYWGWGLVSGLNKLQDDDNYKNYTIGNWLQTLIVGLLTVAIAGVLAYYVYNFGSTLAGGN
ncbi:hypothetical protein [Thiomicrorhabdus indica]|uniref:hypothetical protein n=1 Tax=Thiomicrorhabdus indica TaxID=2267253 RepID=UPI00102DDA1F|nr:hypothetical protein [Thiomicrorhabdus indica]